MNRSELGRVQMRRCEVGRLASCEASKLRALTTKSADAQRQAWHSVAWVSSDSWLKLWARVKTNATDSNAVMMKRVERLRRRVFMGESSVMFVGLGDRVVVVTVIVAAQTLIQDVAKYQEPGTCHRKAPFSELIQILVARQRCDRDKSQSRESQQDNTDIPVSPTTQGQGNKGCWQNQPEQNGVECFIS